MLLIDQKQTKKIYLKKKKRSRKSTIIATAALSRTHTASFDVCLLVVLHFGLPVPVDAAQLQALADWPTLGHFFVAVDSISNLNMQNTLGAF